MKLYCMYSQFIIEDYVSIDEDDLHTVETLCKDNPNKFMNTEIILRISDNGGTTFPDIIYQTPFTFISKNFLDTLFKINAISKSDACIYKYVQLVNSNKSFQNAANMFYFIMFPVVVDCIDFSRTQIVKEDYGFDDYSYTIDEYYTDWYFKTKNISKYRIFTPEHFYKVDDYNDDRILVTPLQSIQNSPYNTKLDRRKYMNDVLLINEFLGKVFITDTIYTKIKNIDLVGVDFVDFTESLV